MRHPLHPLRQLIVVPISEGFRMYFFLFCRAGIYLSAQQSTGVSPEGLKWSTPILGTLKAI